MGTMNQCPFIVRCTTTSWRISGRRFNASPATYRKEPPPKKGHLGGSFGTDPLPLLAPCESALKVGGDFRSSSVATVWSACGETPAFTQEQQRAAVARQGLPGFVLSPRG